MTYVVIIEPMFRMLLCIFIAYMLEFELKLWKKCIAVSYLNFYVFVSITESFWVKMQVWSESNNYTDVFDLAFW